MPTTPGSNITNYADAPLKAVRYDLRVVPVWVKFAASGAVSVFSCPVAISCASAAAAGVINFTLPSGLTMITPGFGIKPIVSTQSASQWYIVSKTPTTGQLQLVHVKENAAGTTVTGVSPATGDELEFVAYIHSVYDGGAL